MKWFKHDTDCDESEGLSFLIESEGWAGYGRWFRLLEIVASKMDKTDRCHAEFSIQKWCSLLGLKQKKLKTFLELTENKLKTKVVCSGNILRIEVPNLLKKRDEYSRKSGESQENIPPKIKEERIQIKDTDKRKKNKEYICPLPDNPELEKPKDFCLVVLEDLNAKAGKNYRSIKTTITLIESRRKEGFTLTDFQKVHDNMCAKWKNDPKMNQYLRPATLYQASKFEGYLNTTVSLSDRGLISEKTEKGLHNVQSWLEKEQAKEEGNAE